MKQREYTNKLVLDDFFKFSILNNQIISMSAEFSNKPA
uniref:Uncharacterized protein n=1 Tax=Arundo donax TaxID=35708 RepID=A0A0A8ZWH1_ARUDO